MRDPYFFNSLLEEVQKSGCQEEQRSQEVFDCQCLMHLLFPSFLSSLLSIFHIRFDKRFGRHHLDDINPYEVARYTVSAAELSELGNNTSI